MLSSLYCFKGEKEKLIKEKKIRRVNLGYIKEEEIPFEIPNSWKWVKLGEIGDWGAGVTPLRSNKSYYENGILNWLKTGDLNDSYIGHIEEKISQKALDETSIRINRPGDILLAMYGATIGKTGILLEEATTNQACCACSVHTGVYNLYLFNYLLSQKNNFIEMGAGGAQPNISRTKIINHVFPLPPLNEQKRIVIKLDLIMNYLKKLKYKLNEEK